MFDVILGLVLMVLGWAIPATWTIARRRLQLGLAKRVFPAESSDNRRPVLHLRASFDAVEFGQNPPTLRGYTHSGDVQAIVRIFEFFDDLPVKLEFDYFPEIRHDMRNVIIVGLSSRSDVSRELAEELYSFGVRVKGDGNHGFYKDAAGVEYRCAHAEKSNGFIVKADVGVVVRRKTESGCTILLCGGIHTFGSQAAAEVALSRDFQKRVKKSKLEEFVQFVTVDVQQSGDRAGLAAVRQSIRWKDLPLQPIRVPAIDPRGIRKS